MFLIIAEFIEIYIKWLNYSGYTSIPRQIWVIILYIKMIEQKQTNRYLYSTSSKEKMEIYYPLGHNRFLTFEKEFKWVWHAFIYYNFITYI